MLLNSIYLLFACIMNGWIGLDVLVCVLLWIYKVLIMIYLCHLT